VAEVAVLIPLMRAHRIAPVVESIIATTDSPHIVVIATGECANATRDLPVTLLEDTGGSWGQRINAGYKLTSESIVMTAADDLFFHPGWFPPIQRALDAIDGGGVCAVNDTYNAAGVHFCLSKSYIETIGGVLDQPPGVICCEDYVHSFVDDELRATAQFHGRWGGVIRESVVEHQHYGAGKADHDAVYAAGSASMPQGLATLQSRSHLWAA